MPQVLQFEEPQEAQPPPAPATGVLKPLESVEKQAKVDITLFAPLRHFGQGARSVALLSGRSNSNLTLQQQPVKVGRVTVKEEFIHFNTDCQNLASSVIAFATSSGFLTYCPNTEASLPVTLLSASSLRVGFPSISSMLS